MADEMAIGKGVPACRCRAAAPPGAAPVGRIDGRPRRRPLPGSGPTGRGRAACPVARRAGPRARAGLPSSRPVVRQDLECVRGRVGGDHAAQLGTDALLRHPAHEIGRASHCRRGARLDVEVELGRKPSSAQQPQSVLVEARGGSPTARSTKRRRSARPSVGSASAGSLRFTAGSSPGYGVDGEIAPHQVLADLVRESYRVGAPMVCVLVVTPEGRYLDAAFGGRHGDRPEAVLVAARRKQFARSFRARIGGDIPVGHAPSEQLSRTQPPTRYAAWPAAIASPARAYIGWRGDRRRARH